MKKYEAYLDFDKTRDSWCIEFNIPDYPNYVISAYKNIELHFYPELNRYVNSVIKNSLWKRNQVFNLLIADYYEILPVRRRKMIFYIDVNSKNNLAIKYYCEGQEVRICCFVLKDMFNEIPNRIYVDIINPKRSIFGWVKYLMRGV